MVGIVGEVFILFQIPRLYYTSFWGFLVGVLVLLLLLVVVVVTGGKQNQLLVRLTWTRLLDLNWSLTMSIGTVQDRSRKVMTGQARTGQVRSGQDKSA